MRILLAILLSVTFFSTKAQSHLPVPTWGFGYMPWQPAPLFNSPGKYFTAHKWQLVPSAGLSAGYIFYNAGMSYVSAPLALTLYRPLTSNVTAFGGVFAAPTVFSVNSLYAAPPNGKFSGSPFAQSYGLGINAGIQGGLMYTNDSHTFSISGSISVQRGSTPVYYPSQRNTDTKH